MFRRYNAARAMEEHSELCMGSIMPNMCLEKPTDCEYSSKFAARWDVTANEIRQLRADLDKLAKHNSPVVDELVNDLASSAVAENVDVDSYYELLKTDATERLNTLESTTADGNQESLSSASKAEVEEDPEQVKLLVRILRLCVKLRRERFRVSFLQQARKHFQAAHRTCRLKNVEMRGRCVLPCLRPSYDAPQ